MTTASSIINLIQRHHPAVFTLAHGYLAVGPGAVIRFEPGHVLRCNRNAKGRVTLARVQYRDGSQLCYRHRKGCKYSSREEFNAE